jgi:hypothetical protein
MSAVARKQWKVTLTLQELFAGILLKEGLVYDWA